MKLKLLVALLASSLWCGWAQAQIGDIANPLNGRITVADAGTCSTANSFVTQQLPQNASTTTVNLSGTFTATLTARLSNNGGATWTTGGAVAAGTTSFSTNGFTHICVDTTAFTSGTVLVSISTGILQVQSVVAGGSSSSSSPCVGAGCINAASSTYGAFHDAQFVKDASWTSGVASGITSPTAAWTSADAGKTIWGFNGCNPTGTAGTQLATLGAAAQTTILSVQSATSITISANPTSSPVGVGCLVWGHMDDTGLTAAEAALAALTVCGAEQFPAAYGMIAQPHFYTLPQACQNLPAFQSGVALWGNGVKYRGMGKGVSRYFLAPWFDMTKCTRGTTSTACFGWVQEGLYEDFSLDGVANTRSGTTSAKKLSEPGGYVELRNMGLHSFGAADGDLDGIYNNCVACNVGGPLYLENVSMNGWGTRSLHQASGGTWAKGTSFQTNQATDGSSVLVESNAEFLSLGANGFFGGFGIANQSYIRNNGGIVSLAPNDICRPDVSSAANFCVRVNGGVTNIVGSDLSMNTGVGPNAGNLSLFCNGSGAVVNLHQAMYENTFAAAATGATMVISSGCIVNELGGSFGLLSGTASNTYTGTLNMPGNQIKAACTGTVAASLTTGGIYNTGPNIAATACNASPNNTAPGTLGAGVPMQGARTVFALQVSATAAGTNASSGVVTVMKNGVATSLTCTVGTSTTCLDSLHNVAFADGDLITFQYTSQAADTLAGLKIVVHWL